MPLDGSNTRGAEAVRVIDLMLELFDDGKGWICHWRRRRPRRPIWQGCLMSAVLSVQHHHKLHGGVERYLKQSILVETNGAPQICKTENTPWDKRAGMIVTFNDSWRRNQKDRYHTVIEPMLRRARDLAEADV